MFLAIFFSHSHHFPHTASLSQMSRSRKPALQWTRRVYHRLQQAIPQYLWELEGPLPVCFFEFTDSGNMADAPEELGPKANG